MRIKWSIEDLLINWAFYFLPMEQDRGLQKNTHNLFFQDYIIISLYWNIGIFGQQNQKKKKKEKNHFSWEKRKKCSLFLPPK